MQLELRVKMPEWLQLLWSGGFIVNFQQILHIHLVFPLVASTE